MIMCRVRPFLAASRPLLACYTSFSAVYLYRRTVIHGIKPRSPIKYYVAYLDSGVNIKRYSILGQSERVLITWYHVGSLATEFQSLSVRVDECLSFWLCTLTCLTWEHFFVYRTTTRSTVVVCSSVDSSLLYSSAVDAALYALSHDEKFGY